MRQYKDNIELHKPTMFFTGVTTHNSLVNEVFNDWIKIIGKDAELVGINLDVDCDTNEYLKIVSFMKSHPLALGSLVTTHKVRLYNYSNQLFDELPETCNEFKEIGCIYKNVNSLCGEVTDLFTVRAALDVFLPIDYFQTHSADFCILGGGGAGLALAYRILTDKNPKPKKLFLTDISENRLATIKSILEKYDADNILQLSLVTGQADNLIENLKIGSVIVNATGLGKDRKGSPFSRQTNIPNDCFLWEFNYRGELDFMQIANEQAKQKNLKVFDGWIYFIHGWTQVMSRVFHIENIADYFDKFLEVANSKR